MKGMFRIALILGILIVLLLYSFPVSGASPHNPPEFVSDHILVQFKPGTSVQSMQSTHARHGGSVTGDITPLNIQVIKVPEGKVAEEIRAYRSDKDVEYAEPDYLVRAVGTTDDPDISQQWGLARIQAMSAWDVTTGSASVRVAVVDTGIDQDHEDLAAKIVANQNFSTSLTVDDLCGHGTHVAGIIAAITNNDTGVAGIGYNTSLMNVKVLDDTGNGTDLTVANGIIWAADNGANVINLSLGGSGSSVTLENAVNYAWSRGVVVVAAAGNNGNSTPFYPADYSNVISVAATNQNDALASFSNYGGWVDVAAPGVGVLSTLPNHPNYFQQIYGYPLNYGSLDGTSMAAPFVSGLAALLWTTPYGTSASAVRSRIENTADPIAGTGPDWQYGRINAFAAVQHASINFITSPQTIIAGQASDNITVQARDSAGNPVNVNHNTHIDLTSSSSTGAFDTSSGGPFNGSITRVTIPAGSSSAYFFYRDTAAGTPTITASGAGYVSASQNETISPAPAARINVETSADGSGSLVPDQNITSGSALNIYSVTRDQYGNFVSNAAGTWSLSNITGGVADTDLVSASDNRSAVFTGHLAGTAVIHVASGGLASTGSGMLNIIPGSAARLGVAGYPSPVIVGTSNSFTVTARDTSGNTVTGYSGTVHFTISDNTTSLDDYTFTGAGTENDNGTHTFNFTFGTVGTQSITATDTTDNITGTQSGIIVTAALVGTTTTVSSSANPLYLGRSVTFTAAVTGAGGTPTGTVQFSIDGSDFGSPVPLDNGQSASPPTSSLTAGTHSITAAYSGDENFSASTGTLNQTVSSGGGNSGGGGYIFLPPPPPMLYSVATDGFTSTPALVTNAAGLTQNDTDLQADRGDASLKIAKNTRLLDASGKILTALSASHLVITPQAPDQNTIILDYQFGPEKAAFTPAVTLTFKYSPLSLPDGASPQDLSLASWDGSRWTALDSTVDTEAGMVSAQISHFSQYALMVKLPPPPEFSISNLSISPARINPGEVATIQVSISNTGGSSGFETVVLKINGTQEDSRNVRLGGGEEQAVTFQLQKETAGKYAVDVNGLSGEFTVEEPSPVPTVIETPPVPQPEITPSAPVPETVTPAPGTGTPASITPSSSPSGKKTSNSLLWSLVLAGVILVVLVIPTLMQRGKKH